MCVESAESIADISWKPGVNGLNSFLYNSSVVADEKLHLKRESLSCKIEKFPNNNFKIEHRRLNMNITTVGAEKKEESQDPHLKWGS